MSVLPPHGGARSHRFSVQQLGKRKLLLVGRNSPEPTKPRRSTKGSATDGVTVRKALSIGGLTKARVVAGFSGLDRVIRYVDIIEVPDFAAWLRPNVFSMTCAYALKDDPDALVNLVRHSARSGAAGLAVKPGRFLGSMPEEMIRAADEEGIPLIEIPADLPYIEITHPLQSAILEEELRALEHQMDVNVRKAVVDLMVRERGIEGVAETLSNLLERNVYILDETATLIAACRGFAGLFSDQKEVTDLASHLMGAPAPFIGATAAQSEGERPDGPPSWSYEKADVFRIEDPQCECADVRGSGKRFLGFVVVDVGARGHLRFAEAAAAYQAAVAIGLEVSSARLTRDTRRRMLAELLSEILPGDLSSASEEAVASKASILGIDLKQPYVVAVITSVQSGDCAVDEMIGEVEKYLERAGNSQGIRSAIADCDPGVVAICMRKDALPDDRKPYAPEFPPWVDPYAERVVTLLKGLQKTGAGRSSMRIGVSSIQTGVSGIVTGYSQAVQVLKLGPSGSWVARFDQTSPAVLLQGLNRRQLEDYYQAVLGRLSGDNTLVHTLKVFRNTLAYRLKSIERKLCSDLRDPDVQLRLRLAILAGMLTGKC